MSAPNNTGIPGYSSGSGYPSYPPSNETPQNNPNTSQISEDGAYHLHPLPSGTQQHLVSAYGPYGQPPPGMYPQPGPGYYPSGPAPSPYAMMNAAGRGRGGQLHAQWQQESPSPRSPYLARPASARPNARQQPVPPSPRSRPSYEQTVRVDAPPRPTSTVHGQY